MWLFKIKKVYSKEATEVTRIINQLLEEFKPCLHTITSNNKKRKTVARGNELN